jgi:CubicO group peptidase (beta-lactamase class C family)
MPRVMQHRANATSDTVHQASCSNSPGSDGVPTRRTPVTRPRPFRRDGADDRERTSVDRGDPVSALARGFPRDTGQLCHYTARSTVPLPDPVTSALIMKARRIPPSLVVLLLLALPAGSLAQGPSALPTVAGFDAVRLAFVDSTLQRYVDEERIAGAVALVMRDGEVVFERAVGWADRDARRRMSPDAIFRIASQSKAITSAAVMMLVEEGRVNLGDPVSRWLPTFATTTVAVQTDTGTVFVPARRPITIRDLLTHTAGISYGGEPPIAALNQAEGLGYGTAYGWYTAHRDEPICETMDRLGMLPIVQHPGAAWVYGYNTDILGCVVERASNRPLDEFIRERITGPLEMRDTHFFLPPDQRARLATVYTLDDSGRAVRAPDGPRGQGDYVDGPRRSFAGGSGLLSTARDYARFLEMIRNRGTLDGVRYLSPRIVELMTSNQIGGLRDRDGIGFGLGFESIDRPGAGGFSSVGSFGWSGAYGSMYRVDPVERLVMVLMIQVVPFSDGRIRESFDTTVYQALAESYAD